MIVYCPHCNQKYEMDDNVTEFICLSCGMKSTESGYFEKHKKSLFVILSVSVILVIVAIASLSYYGFKLKKELKETSKYVDLWVDIVKSQQRAINAQVKLEEAQEKRMETFLEMVKKMHSRMNLHDELIKLNSETMFKLHR